MTSRSDIRATVLHLVARASDISVSQLEHVYTLGADVGLHDDQIAELAMDIEADLGVEVPDDEFERWVTVGDVVRGMERLTKAEKEEERERAPLTKRKGGKKGDRVEQGSLLS